MCRWWRCRFTYIHHTTYHFGVSCCRFTDIHHTTYHFGVSCWRFTDIRQHKIPFWCVVLEVYRHTPHNIPFWCVVLEVYRHTPTQNTILVCRVGGLPTYANTKYLQHDIPFWCVVLGGLLTYANTRYLQHDIPLLYRFGGLPTYTTQNTSNTTYHFGVSCWEVYRHTPTQDTSNTTYHCGMSFWRFTDIHDTKYLQHDIPLVCRVCSHLSTIVVFRLTDATPLDFGSLELYQIQTVTTWHKWHQTRNIWYSATRIWSHLI